MSRWGRVRGNRVAVTVALAACLACLALACTAPSLLAVGGGRHGPAAAGGLKVVPLCAWARNGRVGLWWNVYVQPAAPLMRSQRYNAVCVAAPWVPGLPDRGRPSVGYLP